MERVFKDVGINVILKPRTITLSGDTEKLRGEFTNLGGKELKNGNWSFPRKMERALVEVIEEIEVKDVRLNSENMSTPEILEVCKVEGLAIDTNNRDACVKGADEVKPYIDPEEISLQIRKELEKTIDLDKADPKIIYDVVVAYFGQDIAPLYENYLPLYQEELGVMKEYLDVEDMELALLHTYDDLELLGYCSNLGLNFVAGDVESCKVALLSHESPLGRELRENIKDIVIAGGSDNDVTIPTVMTNLGKMYGKGFVNKNKSFLVEVIDEELQIFSSEGFPKPTVLPAAPIKKGRKVVVPTSTTKRKKPRSPLDLDKKTRELFENIREGMLTYIITFAPEGVDFVYSETTSEKAYADVKDLMQKQITEDGKTYTIRKHITAKVARLTDLQLTPDTVILLGFLFTKKVLYAVTYDPYVEMALQYVLERI